MTDFNFLRIKWPKLAAIAADAGRLVEVSPSSAISTMQNFSEWAADIALDFYDIETQNGITQQEKLDTLKATGHVPADILNRFHNVMMAGGRHLYRANEDVEEARQCLEDVYEIGRWLNKEADRSGWPPKTDYYRPVMSSMGLQGESGGGTGFSTSRAAKSLGAYKPLILMVGGTLVVIVATIFLIKGFLSAGTGAHQTAVVISTTPSVSSTLLSPTPDATATPVPEVVDFLDSLTPKSKPNSFFLKKWAFQSGDKNFTIGDRVYENGIGMYIPKKSIAKSQGTQTISFNLDGKYEKLRFDLGVDAKLQYSAGYGKFRVLIYCDSTNNDPVYDSGLREYDYTDLAKEVDIHGCQLLIIKLTEVKGTKGTINVVLGDIRAVQGGGSAEPTDTTGPDETATEGATATATSTQTDTESPDATSKTSTTSPDETSDNNNGEQEQPPG